MDAGPEDGAVTTFADAVTVIISPPPEVETAADGAGVAVGSGGWLARTPPFTVAA